MGECSATDWIQAVGTILQAVLAGLVAWYAYRIAKCQILPIITIRCTDRGKRVSITNNGLGPALICSLTFSSTQLGNTEVVAPLRQQQAGYHQLATSDCKDSVMPPASSVELLDVSVYMSEAALRQMWNEIGALTITVCFCDGRGADGSFSARAYKHTARISWPVDTPSPVVEVQRRRW